MGKEFWWCRAVAARVDRCCPKAEVERRERSRGEGRGTRGFEGGKVFDPLAVVLHQVEGTDDDCEG